MKKERSLIKSVLKIIGVIISLAISAFVGLVLFLTVTEFKPDDVTAIPLEKTVEKTVPKNKELTIVSFNMGFAGMGKESDFFMDGGKQVFPKDKELVEKNLDGISEILQTIDADFTLLQEVDLDSRRSYNINEQDYLTEQVFHSPSLFAANYKAAFVPVPFPPLGKMHSGLLTNSRYDVGEANRVSLTVPFKWPVRLANLKRCLLTTRLPIEGSDKELVLVNLHLEAYDDTGGRETQTRELINLMKEEYEKGNYVIAGGDFNQSLFPLEELPFELSEDIWKPGVLDDSILPDGYQLLRDETLTPSCRSLHEVYDPSSKDMAYYIIDGFIATPNITVNQVETYQQNFEYSDHNPIVLNFMLKD
ncbi:endonuclease/exonuclease/phosphatase family protein [Streptococcus sp. CSL10205-OR2]|uniref:endonuclease/exonuclease/phosphatase family protein n=1 Tax=Streptococcus sp. CSL10205-OR2 TaxID=2980558 RepID=UPI0021D87406|nr:endonuclease/exonuclease/phosphatase family protein [Streptococcus sp. CSL10205-OR2]MCU9533261.1 endonuclease [Streptococcus sp. CSL10205-OR2]